MRRFGKFVVAILVVAVANVAFAADRFSCSMWSTVVSRALFDNTGTFATSGAVLQAVPECVDSATGLYGNLFLSVPLENFDNGKEIDVRVGKRFDVGQFNIDASIAYYYFGIGAPPGVKNMYSTAESKVRLSRLYVLREGLDVRPFVIAEYQRSITADTNSFGVAGGLEVNWALGRLPGKPVLGVAGSGWHYTTSPTPSTGPIWNVTTSLSYTLGKVTIGPRALWTWGDVNHPGDYKPKHMYGGFAFIPF